jgi:hypothetical protein
MFWPHTDEQFYTTTPHFLLNLVVFGLPKNHRHFYIDLFRPVSTTSHHTSANSPHFNLRRFLNRIDLHICITLKMCIGLVTALGVGQSASSTCWYIIQTILTYSLRLINIHLTTIISTQQPSYPLSDLQIHSATLISTKQQSLWHHYHDLHGDGLPAF